MTVIDFAEVNPAPDARLLTDTPAVTCSRLIRYLWAHACGQELPSLSDLGIGTSFQQAQGKVRVPIKTNEESVQKSAGVASGCDEWSVAHGRGGERTPSPRDTQTAALRGGESRFSSRHVRRSHECRWQSPLSGSRRLRYVGSDWVVREQTHGLYTQSAEQHGEGAQVLCRVGEAGYERNAHLKLDAWLERESAQVSEDD